MKAWIFINVQYIRLPLSVFRRVHKKNYFLRTFWYKHFSTIPEYILSKGFKENIWFSLKWTKTVSKQFWNFYCQILNLKLFKINSILCLFFFSSFLKKCFRQIKVSFLSSKSQFVVYRDCAILPTVLTFWNVSPCLTSLSILLTRVTEVKPDKKIYEFQTYKNSFTLLKLWIKLLSSNHKFIFAGAKDTLIWLPTG